MWYVRQTSTEPFRIRPKNENTSVALSPTPSAAAAAAAPSAASAASHDTPEQPLEKGLFVMPAGVMLLVHTRLRLRLRHRLISWRENDDGAAIAGPWWDDDGCMSGHDGDVGHRMAGARVDHSVPLGSQGWVCLGIRGRWHARVLGVWGGNGVCLLGWGREWRWGLGWRVVVVAGIGPVVGWGVRSVVSDGGGVGRRRAMTAGVVVESTTPGIHTSELVGLVMLRRGGEGAVVV